MDTILGMPLLRLLEIGIVVCGVLYVLFIAMEQRVGWWFGVAASFGSVYFFIQINLFAEAFLAVYYVLVGLYGFYHWKYGGDSGESLPIQTRRWPFHLLTCALCLLVSLAVAEGLKSIGSDYPHVDAATTVFSLFATWMAARKILENWIYWVVIDAVYIWLYWVKEAPVYAGLMAFYTVLAAVGFFVWLRNYIAQSAEKAQPERIATG